MMESQNPLSFDAFSERGEWISQQSITAGWLERLDWPALEVIDDELMTRTRSTSGFREFNNVFATRIEEANLARDVTRCLEILAQEDAPSRWYLTGHAASSTIAEQLNSLGFREYERYSIMARNLNTPAETQHPSPPTDSPEKFKRYQLNDDEVATTELGKGEYGRVTDEHTLRKWANTLAEVSDYPQELESDWLDMLLSCGLGSDGAWRHYYYQRDGHLAGILSALWTDQIVSVETVGVLADYRNQGVGRNLLRYALEDATRAGYQVASAYPIDYLQGFFSKNAFTKFGTIDCVSIGAAQLRHKQPHVNRNAVATSLAPNVDSKENSRVNL